jgi:hypothetical protein
VPDPSMKRLWGFASSVMTRLHWCSMGTERASGLRSSKNSRPLDTILGWEVSPLDEVVDDLSKKGVEFERYEWIQQDERGIWTAPGGARIAWFKDPDANVLSISEPTKQMDRS